MLQPTSVVVQPPSPASGGASALETIAQGGTAGLILGLVIALIVVWRRYTKSVDDDRATMERAIKAIEGQNTALSRLADAIERDRNRG